MSNNKNSGVFGKGYYIALILCAAAVTAAGVAYYRNAGDTPVSMNAEPTDAVMAPVQEAGPGSAGTDGENDPVRTTEGTTPPTQKRTLKTAAPVSGETVMEYWVETLGYNETTRDWRTHAGIDIAAEAGTPVLAAAEGVVYTVCEDETLGTTVVIRHEGDYTTQYSSLASEVLVEPGDAVSLGQPIGAVGTTALLETVQGDHVHFSVTCQGDPMDPAEFLAME